MQKILMALLLFASFTVAAPSPIPKPFRDVCKQDLLGTWEYSGCGNYGEMTFFDGGFLLKESNPYSSKEFKSGYWKIQKGVLTLTEVSLSENGEWEENVIEHRFDKIKDKTKITTLDGESYYFCNDSNSCNVRMGNITLTK